MRNHDPEFGVSVQLCRIGWTFIFFVGWIDVIWREVFLLNISPHPMDGTCRMYEETELIDTPNTSNPKMWRATSGFEAW